MPQRRAYQRGRREEPQRLARGLGWFSLGLGVAQVLAPRAVARLTGVPIPPVLMVLCGLRELACGAGILSRPQPLPWVNARIAGDALDLAGLAAALAIPGVDRKRLALATAAVAGVAALDVYSARDLASQVRRAPLYIASSVVVDRPAGVVYGFWRDLENLPRVMPHLQSVRTLGTNRSHWVAYAPWGSRLEWYSELIDDVPNERLAWRTIDGSDIYNAGSVRFRPVDGGSATEVTVELLYVPPAGALGAAVAKLFGKDAGQEMSADLDAFKQLMESTSGGAASSSM
ncbi:MAG: SRPBCC family protein [Burkholderiales bacterium]